jgi:hypothetical protein
MTQLDRLDALDVPEPPLDELLAEVAADDVLAGL